MLFPAATLLYELGLTLELGVIAPLRAIPSPRSCTRSGLRGRGIPEGRGLRMALDVEADADADADADMEEGVLGENAELGCRSALGSGEQMM